MFPFTEKYTEPEYDIQNINLLYKIHQQCQTTLDLLGHFRNTFQKSIQFLFCFIHKLHKAYFIFL